VIRPERLNVTGGLTFWEKLLELHRTMVSANGKITVCWLGKGPAVRTVALTAAWPASPEHALVRLPTARLAVFAQGHCLLAWSAGMACRARKRWHCHWNGLDSRAPVAQAQIYLLGNPLAWWPASMCAILAFPLLLVFHALAAGRGFYRATAGELQR
jgi:dolichyl-phosphate-mannose--protein O-mannosyl transferase